MASSLVRVSERSQSVLRDLAARTGQTQQAILDQALEEYRRQRFFAEMDAAYGALQADDAEWSEELAERQEWDATLADGLTASQGQSTDG